MTTTTATLRMLLLICISLGQIRLVSMQSTKVPVDGVYLITMVADPDGRTDMFLQLNGRDAGFVAYAQGDAVAGLVVAVYLKAGTRVSARYTGHAEGATSLGVGFASYEKSNFVTLRSKDLFAVPHHLVQFDYSFQPTGVWIDNWLNYQYSIISTSGIYWVAARPDCANGAVSLDVGTGLFNAFCDGDKAISASGAFYLQAGRSGPLRTRTAATRTLKLSMTRPIMSAVSLYAPDFPSNVVLQSCQGQGIVAVYSVLGTPTESSRMGCDQGNKVAKGSQCVVK